MALAFTTGTLFTLSVDDEGVMTGFTSASPSSSCGEAAGDSLRWESIPAPGQDTSLTTQVRRGNSALSLHPMGEIPMLCSLQPRNVQNLRIHSNEQATCIQHLKTYQDQSKQVVSPSTKRSTGKKPEHLFFS